MVKRDTFKPGGAVFLWILTMDSCDATYAYLVSQCLIK